MRAQRMAPRLIRRVALVLLLAGVGVGLGCHSRRTYGRSALLAITAVSSVNPDAKTATVSWKVTYSTWYYLRRPLESAEDIQVSVHPITETATTLCEASLGQSASCTFSTAEMENGPLSLLVVAKTSAGEALSAITDIVVANEPPPGDGDVDPRTLLQACPVEGP